MIKNGLFFIVFLSFVLGCSTVDDYQLLPWERGVAVKITDIRPAAINASKVEVKIPYKDYVKALAEGGNKNTARLVEVYNNSKNNPNLPPEYRVFDVQKGGVYELLRLQTADIIISANGYVIPNQQIFIQYLNMMAQLKKGSLEIIRSGRTFNISYVLTE